jgi:hypothetical protein
MLPVNPLIAAAETVTVWLLPSSTVTLEGEDEMEKSAAGGGGAEFYPHPPSTKVSRPKAVKNSPRQIQQRASAMRHPHSTHRVKQSNWLRPHLKTMS